jgi:putative ABC transport system permease protein
MSGPSDTGVYIPISKAQSFFNTNETDTIIVQLTNSDDATISNVREDIKSLFNDQVQVISPTAILNTITATFSTIEIFLAGIASISLLVAGIGIMNIMIVSLMERTREIGILKALGMKNRTVLSIFLSESVIIGLMGTAIGIASGWVLAIGASRVLARFSGGQGGFGGGQMMTGGLPITPIITPIVLLGAFAFGLIITVIFALYPAWRASRLKPVEALRSE